MQNSLMGPSTNRISLLSSTLVVLVLSGCGTLPQAPVNEYSAVKYAETLGEMAKGRHGTTGAVIESAGYSEYWNVGMYIVRFSRSELASRMGEFCINTGGKVFTPTQLSQTKVTRKGKLETYGCKRDGLPPFIFEVNFRGYGPNLQQSVSFHVIEAQSDKDFDGFFRKVHQYGFEYY
ncbi:hypothetical protein [Azotobacter chroococcum]|uniref:hypothetical protein n=1 Tax=Azotobacter chroococcum TaxID=353 RepID=UPI0011860983|nr:hypothetical protein [Azotobacter chroococcum]